MERGVERDGPQRWNGREKANDTVGARTLYNASCTQVGVGGAGQRGAGVEHLQAEPAASGCRKQTEPTCLQFVAAEKQRSRSHGSVLRVLATRRTATNLCRS